MGEVHLCTNLFCLFTPTIFLSPVLLAVTVIFYQFVVPSVWTLITWCSRAPLPCTKRSRSLCAHQIVISMWRIPLTLWTLPQQKRVRIDLAGVTAAQSHCLSLFPLLPPAAWQGTGTEASPPPPTPKSFTVVSVAPSVITPKSVCVCVFRCRKFF